MAKHDFRSDVLDAIVRAKKHLETTLPSHEALRYAALDVRMAMEALTYERAQIYAEELPASVYETWQPRKLMRQLLDLDPSADQGGSLSVGEEEDGQPAKVMTFVGTETVLSMASIKRHYDALGSYLHMPTVAQIRDEGLSQLAGAEKRLRTIIAQIDAVLASQVFNVSFGNFSTGQCGRCQAKIRRRIPFDTETLEAICLECGAAHDLTVLPGQGVQWQPRQTALPCAHPGCGETSYLWADDVVPDQPWTCRVCLRTNLIVLGIRPTTSEGLAVDLSAD